MKKLAFLYLWACMAVPPSSASELFYWDGGSGNFATLSHWRQTGEDEFGNTVLLPATRIPGIAGDQTSIFSDGIHSFTVDISNELNITMIYMGSNGAPVANLVFHPGSYHLSSSLIVGLPQREINPSDPDNTPPGNVTASVMSGVQLEVHNAIEIGSYGAALFHQYGGVIDNTDPNNAFMAIGNDDYDCDEVPNPGIAEYQLHDGLLKTRNVGLAGDAAEAHFHQLGGTHTVSEFLSLEGNGRDDVPGRYFLDGGRLEAYAVHINWGGRFDQTAGEAVLTRLEVVGQHAANLLNVYALSGGSLSVIHEFVGYQSGDPYSEFKQTGGTHSVTNLHLGYGVNGTINLHDGVFQSQNDEQVGETYSIVFGDVTYWWGGTGRFNQHGGAHTANGTIEIGRKRQAWGMYTLSGGTLTAASLALARDAGTGLFVQTGGSAVILADTWIGNSPGDLATLNLNGGEFHTATVRNFGQLNYAGGSLSGNVENDGNIAVSGAGTRTINGNVINRGLFKTTNTGLVINGTYTEAGTFVSDPSQNQFNGDLRVEGTGVLQGGAGDVFTIGGNLTVTTANTTAWNTTLAELVFQGNGPHSLSLSGAAWNDKFAWHKLTVADAGTLNLALGGNSIHVDELVLNSGLWQLGNVTGTIYFKTLSVAGNPVAPTGTPGSGGWYLLPATLNFSPIIVTGMNVSAETDNSIAAGYATAAAYSTDISADDLINAGQASLVSASWDKTPFFADDPVNDGDGHPAGSAAGTYLPAAFGGGARLPFTFTASLNTASNTRGYRITGIHSFAGWGQNGASLANQKFEVQVSTVDSPGFTTLGIFEYSPFSSASTQEAAASKMILTSANGIIATGVDAVRFIAIDHGYNSSDCGDPSIDGTVYFEFDVLGSPVPLPTGFEAWAAGFGIPSNETGDDDHDGIAALMEYALGYDPTVGNLLPGPQPAGEKLQITWPKGAQAATDPKISYEVGISPDLAHWDPPAPADLLENVAGIVLTLPAGQPHRFARLQVTRTQP